MIWRISYSGEKKKEMLWKFLQEHGLRSEKKYFFKALKEARKHFKKDGNYEPGEFFRFLTFKTGKMIDSRLLVELESKFELIFFHRLTNNVFTQETFEVN